MNIFGIKKNILGIWKNILGIWKRFILKEPKNTPEALAFSYVWMTVGLSLTLIGAASGSMPGLVIGGIAGVSLVWSILLE